MSVNDQVSAAQASATTPSGTTPVSALWTTCKSMEATIAWVGLHASSSVDYVNQRNGSKHHAVTLLWWFIHIQLFLCLSHNMQIWGRATATGTFTLTTGHVMESWLLTWPKRCAAAPTTLAVHGINPVSSVLCPALVRSRKHTHVSAHTYVESVKKLKVSFYKLKYYVHSDEFAILCGSERPGYYIDITTGRVIGKTFAIQTLMWWKENILFIFCPLCARYWWVQGNPRRVWEWSVHQHDW